MLTRASGEKWNKKLGGLPWFPRTCGCNIHIVHKSFGKGLGKYGKDAKQFVIDLQSLSKHSAACREDYRKLQLNLDVEITLFIEHSSLRWLSIGPAVRRILEQWKAIVQFVKFLKTDPKKIPHSSVFPTCASCTQES